MRCAQTANYGVNPNPAMPATFVAQVCLSRCLTHTISGTPHSVFPPQAYDIGDPFPSKSCYGYSCCWNRCAPIYQLLRVTRAQWPPQRSEISLRIVLTHERCALASMQTTPLYVRRLQMATQSSVTRTALRCTIPISTCESILGSS